MTTPHQRDKGELPPRKKEHAVEMETLAKDLFGNIHHIMAKELRLSKRASKAQV
jgi:hypothetical protein